LFYLTGGIEKSGTSGFVEGLHAGGLPVIFDPAVDERRNRALDTATFRANERYWEPGMGQVAEPDFPLAHDRPGGVALKLHEKRFCILEPAAYEVVILTRHPEEIRQSWNAMFAQMGDRNRAPAWLTFDTAEAQMERYAARIRSMENHIRARRDMVHVATVRYREDLLADPLGVYRSLGWPIDPEKAAAEIDQAKCRFKLEHLTLGA
jgi:hypothetical protein